MENHTWDHTPMGPTLAWGRVQKLMCTCQRAVMWVKRPGRETANIVGPDDSED